MIFQVKLIKISKLAKEARERKQCMILMDLFSEVESE